MSIDHPPATAAELVGTGQQGTIYLLHFHQPFGHARHYLGWTADLDKRLARHSRGDGSALLRAVAAAGIDWQVARTWPSDRHRERQLKNQGSRSRLCPICRAATGAQLVLALDDPELRHAQAGELGGEPHDLTTSTIGGDLS